MPRLARGVRGFGVEVRTRRVVVVTKWFALRLGFGNMINCMSTELEAELAARSQGRPVPSQGGGHVCLSGWDMYLGLGISGDCELIRRCVVCVCALCMKGIGWACACVQTRRRESATCLLRALVER